MPSNSRAENQYYGKYRECAVVACLNNSEVEYYEDFSFSEEEKKKFMKETKIIANYLGPHMAFYLWILTLLQKEILLRLVLEKATL